MEERWVGKPQRALVAHSFSRLSVCAITEGSVIPERHDGSDGLYDRVVRLSHGLPETEIAPSIP